MGGRGKGRPKKNPADTYRGQRLIKAQQKKEEREKKKQENRERRELNKTPEKVPLCKRSVITIAQSLGYEEEQVADKAKKYLMVFSHPHTSSQGGVKLKVNIYFTTGSVTVEMEQEGGGKAQIHRRVEGREMEERLALLQEILNNPVETNIAPMRNTVNSQRKGELKMEDIKSEDVNNNFQEEKLIVVKQENKRGMFQQKSKVSQMDVEEETMKILELVPSEDIQCSLCKKHKATNTSFREVAIDMKCEDILKEYTTLTEAWRLYQSIAVYSDYRGLAGVAVQIKEKPRPCHLCLVKIINVVQASYVLTTTMERGKREVNTAKY